MIIECPNCGTKYNVRPEAVHPKGRNVRCASCGNQWHEMGEKPDPIELAPIFATTGELVEDPSLMTATDEPPQETAAQEFASAGEVAEASDQPESTGDEAAGELTARRAGAAPHQLEPPVKPGRLVPRAISALLAAVFATILIVPAALFRHQIVAAWPPAARVVALVHPAPQPPGANLSFHDVHSALRTDDKGPILSIDGLIQASAKDKAEKIIVPPIRATLMKDGMEIKSWVFQSGIPTVTSHEPARFSTTLDGTGASDGDIQLTFAADSDLPKAVEK